MLLGTLRAAGDTHFRANPDMEGGAVQLLDEPGARKFLAGAFAHVRLGYAERTPVGDLGARVCHWLFEAHA